MSVKQDLQAIKDSFEFLDPNDQAFIMSLVPFLSENMPKLVAIIEKIPDVEMRFLGLGMSAVSQAGRERLVKAVKEVFGA